jgi:hypothetical protein
MTDAGASTKAVVRDQRDLLEEAVSRLRVISEEQSHMRDMLVGLAAINPNQIGLALLKAAATPPEQVLTSIGIKHNVTAPKATSPSVDQIKSIEPKNSNSE